METGPSDSGNSSTAKPSFGLRRSTTSTHPAPNNHSNSPFDASYNQWSSAVSTMQPDSSSNALTHTATNLSSLCDKDLGSVPSTSSTEAHGRHQTAHPVKALSNFIFRLLRRLLMDNSRNLFIQPVCMLSGGKTKHGE